MLRLVMTLQHAREAHEMHRVEVVKARGLRVADARRLNQADHHTFIGGADPRCYVSAQLGNRGGLVLVMPAPRRSQGTHRAPVRHITEAAPSSRRAARPR